MPPAIFPIRSAGERRRMATTVPGETWLRRMASYVLWPVLYVGGLTGTYAALASTHPLLWFNAAYLSIAIGVGILERVMPYEPRWLADDHETVNDLAHTLLN